MDESVVRAMARWPDVPAVHGWLALDRRGCWRLKGEPIANRAAVAFIGRNYAADEHGCWYFQNGPQRVYVTLAYTPWVLGLEPDGTLRTHTDVDPGRPASALVDEHGAVIIATRLGPGLLSDRDLERFSTRLSDARGHAVDPERAARALEHVADRDDALWVELAGVRLPLESARSAEIAARFGYEPDPAPGPRARARRGIQNA